MKTDTNTLLALCEKTDNDIRSCLNTLQVSRQSSWEFTEKLLFPMESMHTIFMESMLKLIYHNMTKKSFSMILSTIKALIVSQ